jgi:HEAT repeat protein
MPQPPSPLDLLRSLDEGTRREAFDRISVEMNGELARGILGLIASDAPDEVRADAIVSLGPAVEECGVEYMEDEEDGELPSADWIPLSREAFEEVTSALRAVYEDPAQPTIVRRRAMEVLVRDPRPWMTDAIRRDFASEDRDWKMTAIFSMGFVRGFQQELLDTLRSADGDLLYEAVRAAGNAEVQKAAPILEAFALSDETDRDVRLEAIAALPSVDRECFDLLDELADSSDEEVRAAAEEALEELQMFGEDLDDEEEEEE